MSVSVSVSLCVCPRAYLQNYTPKLQFLVHVPLAVARSFCGSFATENDSLPKIILNNTINLFFLNCDQHFGNFKPYQFPSAV